MAVCQHRMVICTVMMSLSARSAAQQPTPVLCKLAGSEDNDEQQQGQAYLQAEQPLPFDQRLCGAPHVGHIVLKQAPLQWHQPLQNCPHPLQSEWMSCW